MFFKVNLFPLICVLSVLSVECVPKYETRSFVPSSIDYLDKSSKAHDQVAMPSNAQKRKESASPSKLDAEPSNDIIDRNQEPRFGFTNVGGTGSGYGISTYPGKIDLGGLIVGAVLGVGTILIIPKILYILSNSYGSYARSEDGGYTQILTKLDDALSLNGIDSTSCMLRMVCSYTQQAAESVHSFDPSLESEEISPVDRMIDIITTNPMLHAALRGTAIQEAMQKGRSNQNCAQVYRNCMFSMETIFSLFSNVIASLATVNATKPSQSTSSPITFDNSL